MQKLSPKHNINIIALKNTEERKSFPALPLLYFTSFLRNKNIKINFFDMNVRSDLNEFISGQLLYKNADIFCVYTGAHIRDIALNYFELKQITSKLKQAKKTVLLFGAFPTAFSSNMLDKIQFDYLLKGTSAVPVLELFGGNDPSKVKGLVKKGAENQSGEAVFQPLDQIIQPDYNSAGIENYTKNVIPIIFSQGCHNLCRFCFHPLQAGVKKDYRPIKNVIDEISYWYLRGFFRFKIVSDSFDINNDKETELIEYLSARQFPGASFHISNMCVTPLEEEAILKMKKAGVSNISLGIESMNDKTLEVMHKPHAAKDAKMMMRALEKHKIPFTVFYLVGYPGDSWESLLNVLALPILFSPAQIHYMNTIPVPGTVLWETTKHKAFKNIIRESVEKSIKAFADNKPLFYKNCIDYAARFIFNKTLPKYSQSVIFAKKAIIKITRPFYRWTFMRPDRPKAISERLISSVMPVIFPRRRYDKRFEQMLSEKIGVKYSKLVSSGTMSVKLALKALGVKEGVEVIMPVFTYYSVLREVLALGGGVKFADVKRSNGNIDCDKIAPLITEKTKIIIVTHTCGLSCDMDEIMGIARKYGLYVIEDAAQAFGSTYKGRHLGAIADIGCFSFQDYKNLPIGEGGLIATCQSQITRAVENIIPSIMGFETTRLKQKAAYNGIMLLKRFEHICKKREENTLFLLNGLKTIDWLRPMEFGPNEKPCFNYAFFYIGEKCLMKKRDLIIQRLKEKGIIAIPPYGYILPELGFIKCKEQFPNASFLRDNSFGLPVHEKLPKNQLSDMITALKGLRN